MKTVIAISAAVLATACMSNVPPETSARDQAELAEELAGRVAEPTVRCVNQRDLGGNESIGEGVILFQGRTRELVYVNRPPAGCPEVGPGRAIRVRTTTSRLCAGDIVEVFDPLNNFGFGGCGLGEFTPYRRAG